MSLKTSSEDFTDKLGLGNVVEVEVVTVGGGAARKLEKIA